MCFKLLVRVLNSTTLRIKPRTVRFNSSSFYLPTPSNPYPARYIPSFRRGLGRLLFGLGEAPPSSVLGLLFSPPFLIIYRTSSSSPVLESMMNPRTVTSFGTSGCWRMASTVRRTLRGVSWKPSRYLFKSTCFSAS